MLVHLANQEGAFFLYDDAVGGTNEVRIAVAPPRKIAMLTLQVLNTDFDFKQITETQQKEFMKTFFKYFHKGGG